MTTPAFDQPAIGTTLLVVAGILFGLTTISAAQAACLKANEDGQVADGRLVIGRFRDAAGRREDVHILQLAAPVCMDGDEDTDKVKRTTRIHVYPRDDKLAVSVRALVGKTVRVKGNPFGQHTSHHHAPIVMEVAEIERR